MLVLNMGVTDSSRVQMATNGPDVIDEALLAQLGLRRHSLALSKGFQKCTFRNSIWRIVPSILFAKWHPAFINNSPNVNSRSPMASKIATFRALH
jgi:hypothetical protein